MDKFKIFKIYFDNLKKTNLKEKTEYTDRAYLQKLIEKINPINNDKIRVIHEPSRIKDDAPDFIIKKNDNTVGLLEVKTLGEKLNLKTNQINRYKKITNNLIITNYLEFIFYENEVPRKIELISNGKKI